MKRRVTFSPSEQYKNNLIDNTILVGSIIGFVAFIVAISTSSERSPTSLNYYSDPISFLVLIALYLFRNKLMISVKVITMLIIIFTFVISDTMNWGFYSLNKVLIVVIPFYAVLVFRFRKVLLIYLITVLAYMTIGYLNYANVIEKSDQLLFRVASLPVWIESGLLLSCVSLIIIVFTL